ncbi:DUF3800 domain-containing protein [Agrobacterium tumefaciens]|nr:DUF3800 domain-containing protein [Agrobacterium tumefaciens]UXS64189.1 DUF3800 domain-containing protein [Agrobacterium tumefaciens]
MSLPVKASPQPRTNLVYFTDESSQTADTYLAVGGLAVPRPYIAGIVADLEAIKAQHGKVGEVKWKGAKFKGGVVHRAYVDKLFELIAANRVHLHLRFSKMADYDHKLSGERRRIDTVSKAFYQLLLHRAVGMYNEKCEIDIVADDGHCTALLPEMVKALHTDEKRKYDRGYSPSVRSIEQRSSAAEPMLQLLDVTLGALSSFRNERHNDGETGPIKRELAEYAFGKTGWASIDGNCPAGNRECVRWNARPLIKLKAG